MAGCEKEQKPLVTIVDTCGEAHSLTQNEINELLFGLSSSISEGNCDDEDVCAKLMNWMGYVRY